MATVTVTDPSDLAPRLRSAAPRDQILLSGKFGEVRLSGIRPEAGVTIAAAAPGAAHFEKLLLDDCANLTFTGLQFWPLSPVPTNKRLKQYLFTSLPNCTRIEVDKSLFRGRADSDAHATWTLADWNAAKIGAVFLRGPNSVVRNSAAIGVQFGYGVAGRSSEIFNNRVFGFSGDGLRATEDNCVVIGNRITDAMQIDDNHSDGFQAFKTDGLLDGIVIKDNVLIESTARPDNPLRAKMQGISFHNGPYANVVIRDNAVATRAPNGMHLNSVKNLEVIGNRVRYADGPKLKWPWIRVHACSGRIVIEDNQAEQFKLQPGIVGRANRRPDYSQPF
jgi:hypothetical protein